MSHDMTVAVIRGAVRRRLGIHTNDEDPITLDADIDEMIREAEVRINLAHPWYWLESEVSQNITTSGTVALLNAASDDHNTHVRYVRGPGGVMLERRTAEEVSRLAAVAGGGTPIYYAVNGNNLLVAPAPSSTQSFTIGVLTFPYLDTITDASTLSIPDWASDLVVEYATFLGFRQRRLLEEAGQARALFEQMLDEAKARADAKADNQGGSYSPGMARGDAG